MIICLEGHVAHVAILMVQKRLQALIIKKISIGRWPPFLLAHHLLSMVILPSRSFYNNSQIFMVSPSVTV